MAKRYRPNVPQLPDITVALLITEPKLMARL